jgi:hypothetical protein
MATVLPKLQGLLSHNPNHLYELVQLARSPGYFTMPRWEEAMQALGLLDDRRRIPDDVRQIILATVAQRGVVLTVCSPLMEKEEIDD